MYKSNRKLFTELVRHLWTLGSVCLCLCSFAFVSLLFLRGCFLLKKNLIICIIKSIIWAFLFINIKNRLHICVFLSFFFCMKCECAYQSSRYHQRVGITKIGWGVLRKRRMWGGYGGLVEMVVAKNGIRWLMSEWLGLARGSREQAK